MNEFFPKNVNSKRHAPRKNKKKQNPAKPRRVKGHGNYSGLGKIGAGIGGFFGGKTGRAIGGFLGDAAGKVIGHGDYEVKSNSLVGPGITFGDGKSSIRVRHSEYLGQVASSVSFVNTSYPVNPGSITTFPWLSQLAKNFERWRPFGLIFEFRSTSATAVSSTNTALGAVVVGSSYNVDDPPFASKRIAESTMFVSSTVPCNSMLHPVECARDMELVNSLMIREDNGSLPVGATRALYDLCITQLMTQGMQLAAADLGEWWVHYDFELMYPKLTTQVTGVAHYRGNTTTGTSPLSNFAFGNSANIGAISGNTENADFIQFANSVSPGNAIQFKATGTFQVVYTARATGNVVFTTLCNTFTGAASTAPTLVNYFGSGSTAGVYPQIGAPFTTSGQLYQTLVAYVDVPAIGGVLGFPSSVIVGGGDWDIVVTRVLLPLILTPGPKNIYVNADERAADFKRACHEQEVEREAARLQLFHETLERMQDKEWLRITVNQHDSKDARGV